MKPGVFLLVVGVTLGAQPVRRHAIEAVVAAADREAVPLLLLLAQTDPDGEGAYSVRTRAEAAANALSGRR